MATQIKTVALIDGYIENAKAKSAIGLYIFCRSLLELAAFTSDITSRLKTVAAEPDEKWKPKGEQFFGVIMRARFGTSNPELIDHLKKSGVSKKNTEPFNVMQSINKLISTEVGGKLKGKYDFLCDYVHHNLSSHYTTSPGFRVGDSAHSSEGGGIIMMKSGPICRYEYPVPSKADKALKETLDILIICLEICINALNEMPRTPYTEKQLITITGSRLGFPQLPDGMFVPVYQ